MFKKLKDKIAEEVKSSPQRIQQLTQSVTERLQNATNDENVFTLGDDDTAASNTSLDAGFTDVSLRTPTPVEHRTRKYSNSSMASDLSFLPHYEPSSNLYHMQSDLDVSASEIEDNASMSSQLGHITKEQVYAAFQKAQMRYHKYRGRYSDLQNHYKLLEKENAKIKTVLVETQDKAIRRVSELREQCSLEQKAKAHLENALRVELDERQIKIDTLETKVKLLKNGGGDPPAAETHPAENLEFLTKHLHDARIEIERLNARIQEMKANTIIFNTKEGEYKQKIKELEKAFHEKTAEHAQVCEKEKEASLKLAQVKMDLHLELHNRDVEISNLKQQVNGGAKLENLQSQNAKLIEKVEVLAQKCQNYESELIKLEQYKIEIANLNEAVSNLRKTNELGNEEHAQLQYAHEELTEKLHNYTIVLNENEELRSKVSQLEEMARHGEAKSKEIESLKSELENLRLLEAQRVEEVEKVRESARASLISLESKIKDKISSEYETKEADLKEEFQRKLQRITSSEDDAKQAEVKLMESQDAVTVLKRQLGEAQGTLNNERDKYRELENNHLDLIDENSKTRNALALLEKENMTVKNDLVKLQGEFSRLREELDESRRLNETMSKCELALTTKSNECSVLQSEIALLQDVSSQQQNENLTLQDTIRQATQQIEDLTLTNQKLTEDLLKNEGEIVSLKSEVQMKSADLESLRSESEARLKKNEEDRRSQSAEIDYVKKEYRKLKSEAELKNSTEFESLKQKSEARIKQLEEDCRLHLDEIASLKKENQKAADDLLKSEASSAELENLKRKSEAQIKQLKENCRSLSAEIDFVKKEYRRLKSETELKSSTELESLKQKSEARIKQLEEDCRLHLDEIASLKKENQKAAEDLLKSEASFIELENLKKESEAKIRKLEEECRLRLDEVASLKERNQSLTEDLFKNEAEHVRLRNEIQEMSAKSFENLKSECEARVEKIEEDCRSKSDEIASLKTENQRLAEDLLKSEELKNEIQVKSSLDFENLKRDSEARIRNCEEEIAALRREEDSPQLVNEKEIELNAVKQALAETETQLASLTLQQGDILVHLNNLEQLTEKLQREKDALAKEKDEQAGLLKMVQDYEKEISAENAKLKGEHEKAQQKQKEVEEKLSETAENLKKQNEELLLKLNAVQKESEGNSIANRHLQDELAHLRRTHGELRSSEEDNKKYIATLQAQLNEKIQVSQALEEKLLQLRQVQMKHDDLLSENTSCRNKLAQVNNEFEELQRRNLQVSSDYKQMLDDHERNVAEFEAYKLKQESAELDLKDFSETKTKLEAENHALARKLEEVELQLRSLEGERLKQSGAEDQTISSLRSRIAELELVKTNYDLLCDENSLNKSESEDLKAQRDEVLRDKKSLEAQLEELERHYNEIEHERQLLKDEIQELKTSPVTYNYNSGDNDVQKEKYLREIEGLRDKYKSLDEANRTSIEFYEAELQKLKVKNEKLNRNLDETLVTLPSLRNEDHNDAADVLEYLRNVLFNYMTGKESLVLAKVIAAVCKFDRQQTELIIQREQQKQTLLGHLFGS